VDEHEQPIREGIEMTSGEGDQSSDLSLSDEERIQQWHRDFDMANIKKSNYYMEKLGHEARAATILAKLAEIEVINAQISIAALEAELALTKMSLRPFPF
jgi:hypothetical protein